MDDRCRIWRPSFRRHRNGPAFAAGPFGTSSVSVAVGAGPDELHAFLAFHFDQGGVDRSREARVVQLDRKVVAFGLLGLFLPRRTQLNCIRVDAEMWSVLGRVFDALEAGLDVER